MPPAGRPDVLLLAPRYPVPALRGDQRRVLGLLEGLAGRARVRVLAFGEGPAPALADVEVRGVKRRITGTLRANAGAPSPRLPLQVRLYLDAAMRAAVAQELERRPPDVVVAVLARMVPYLPPAGPWHRHVDLVDSLALNLRTRARASSAVLRPALRAEAWLMARYEAEAVRGADSASLVAAADRASDPALSRAAVVPNGVDVRSFPFRAPDLRPPVMIFCGNLGYFHNVAPATLVAREVLPRVRREVPDARVRLAGARPAAAVRALAGLDGVTVAADVPSIADELHGASVAVLPVLSGSGMKNKVLEALSAGTPVVANRLGVLGVDGMRDGRHVLLAESPEAMAAACVRLLRDGGLRRRMAAAGRELVEERYGWDRRVLDLLALWRLARTAAEPGLAGDPRLVGAEGSVGADDADG
jgi:glycosyltransferase involved in cell wall biosynthesis